MMPPLLMKLVFSRLPSSAPALVRPVARAITDKALKTFVQPQLDQILKFLEGELANRDWFAGEDMTAADIRMSFPLEGAAARGGLDGRYPRLKDFLARIHARPASLIVQKAIEFDSDIYLKREDVQINGKSILSVMLLAAEKGSEITIIAKGKDQEKAIEAMTQLFKDKFYED